MPKHGLLYKGNRQMICKGKMPCGSRYAPRNISKMEFVTPYQRRVEFI